MSGPRTDGRGYEEFRSIFIDTKVVSQARGSCYVELGDTKVMVGVYGPRQSERKFGFTDTGRLQCEVKLTTFAAGSMAKTTSQAIQEKNIAAALVQALEPSVQLDRFPKAVVDVYGMVLEAGGSELAALITAASAALADAGIELYDLVPACQVARLARDPQSQQPSSAGPLILDPTTGESDQSDAGLLLALQPVLGSVNQLSMSGTWQAGDSKAALELGMGACSQLREAMKAALLSGAEKEAT